MKLKLKKEKIKFYAKNYNTTFDDDDDFYDRASKGSSKKNENLRKLMRRRNMKLLKHFQRKTQYYVPKEI